MKLFLLLILTSCSLLHKEAKPIYKVGDCLWYNGANIKVERRDLQYYYLKILFNNTLKTSKDNYKFVNKMLKVDCDKGFNLKYKQYLKSKKDNDIIINLNNLRG